MADFDVDAFLAQPLVGRLATAGPTVRPIWYLWEDGAFWWLTGPWSRLRDHLAADPEVALVIDTCDLATGHVWQVVAKGEAEVMPYDPERALRKLRRYLGADESEWDRARFNPAGPTDGTGFVRLRPRTMRARDLSYQASRSAPH
ncbi:MAG: pyridoxamine 5'-phosphate oxidase family protein [Egibacteraceae bacterium]